MFHFILINCDILKMGTYFVRLCYASNYTATTTLQWKIPNACDSLERCYLAAKCQEFAYHDIQVNQYFLTQPRHSPACSLALDWLEKTSSSTWSHHPSIAIHIKWRWGRAVSEEKVTFYQNTGHGEACGFIYYALITVSGHQKSI